jgi:Gam-like protein
MKAEYNEYITTTLAVIKKLSATMVAENKKYNAAIEVVKAEYIKSSADASEALKKAEKEFIKHLKKNKLDIFPEKTDRVTVAGGVLIRQIKEVVRKARHITVEFLKKEGKSNGIRIEENVNWEEIETWNDEQLSQIGTERKPKESFAYDITGE